MSGTTELKETPLTAWHRSNGGRMVEFAGYSMPVQYQPGVLAEHTTVREGVGIFDITHMGEIMVTGDGAGAWLDSLVTNKLTGMEPGKVIYTAMCNQDGGVLDDMLIYRLEDRAVLGGPEVHGDHWMVVCNATNHDKIFDWLRQQATRADVVLDDASDRTALIALQGPDSLELVQRIGTLQAHADLLAGLKFYTGTTLEVDGTGWVVSRTGYTGERGYEIYLPNAAALPLWEEIVTAGADLSVLPVGLAARDTLRFEPAYCLYGHELSEDITPLEAGIGWAVKFKKDTYVGMAALQEQKVRGVPRRLMGIEVVGRTIARQDSVVWSGGKAVGTVTSGTFSPTFKRSLALALVPSDVSEDDLEVEVRQKRFQCRAVPIPFLSARIKGDPRAKRNMPAWAALEQEANDGN